MFTQDDDDADDDTHTHTHLCVVSTPTRRGGRAVAACVKIFSSFKFLLEVAQLFD